MIRRYAPLKPSTGTRIPEEGKRQSKSRSTLVACDVPFKSFREINAGPGLWGLG